MVAKLVAYLVGLCVFVLGLAIAVIALYFSVFSSSPKNVGLLWFVATLFILVGMVWLGVVLAHQSLDDSIIDEVDDEDEEDEEVPS